MSSGHPTNVTVYPHYKMFVSVHSFCCCPSPLILGYYSSVIIIHCFPLCLGKKMLFSSLVFFCCAGLFLIQLRSPAASGQESIQPPAGLTGMTSLHSPVLRLGSHETRLGENRNQVLPRTSISTGILEYYSKTYCESYILSHE